MIGIIGILAALLLPALSASKAKASQVSCLNNLKQLGLGFMMHVGDSNDTFPGMASKAQGYHDEDWIYWRPPSDLDYRPVEDSNAARMLGTGRSTNLFLCPADKLPKPNSFQFNYTFNGSRGTNGMGSQWVKGDLFIPFKLAQVTRPSDKIMLAEEPRGPGDMPPGGATDKTMILDDGRWMPLLDRMDGNLISTRHSKKGGNVNFADGHAALVPWQWATNIFYVQATEAMTQ